MGAILALAFLLGVAAADRSPDAPRILVLGDSIAAGAGLQPQEAFPARLAELIQAAGYPHVVVNAGVSGDTSASGARRIDWVLKSPVQILIIELGGNDGLRGIDPETTKKNLQMIIHRAQAKHPQIQIVLAGMRMPPNMGREYTARFEEIYPELARENKVALVPFLLEGVGGDPKFNQDDRIHPTAEGQRIVAATIWKVLEPLLTQR